MSSNPSLSQLPGPSIHPATPITPRLRNPLCRTDSDVLKPSKLEMSTTQRHGSLRSGNMKRVSFSNSTATSCSATTACTTVPTGLPTNGSAAQKLPSAIKSALYRAKPRSKENQEPWSANVALVEEKSCAHALSTCPSSLSLSVQVVFAFLIGFRRLSNSRTKYTETTTASFHFSDYVNYVTFSIIVAGVEQFASGRNLILFPSRKKWPVNSWLILLLKRKCFNAVIYGY